MPESQARAESPKGDLYTRVASLRQEHEQGPSIRGFPLPPPTQDQQTPSMSAQLVLGAFVQRAHSTLYRSLWGRMSRLLFWGE